MDVDVQRVVSEFIDEGKNILGEGKSILIVSDYSHMGKTTYASELYKILKNNGYIFVDGDYIKPSSYKNIPPNAILVNSFDELKKIAESGEKYIIDTPPLGAMVKENGVEEVRKLLNSPQTTIISIENNIFNAYDITLPSLLFVVSLDKTEFPTTLQDITNEIAEGLCERYCQNLDDPYIPENFVDTIISDTTWSYSGEFDIDDSIVLGYEDIFEDEKLEKTFCHDCYTYGSRLIYQLKRIYTFLYEGKEFYTTMHIDTDVCCVCGGHDIYCPF